MKQYLEKVSTYFSNWAVRAITSARAKWWLAAISFAESSFFPIPPDFFLVPIILAKQTARWFYFATITTTSSVLGGIFGYAIGYFLFDSIGKTLIAFYKLEEVVGKVDAAFHDNAFLAIFLAGFTPIPYKLFTISAGFFGINLLIFLVASIISRAMRFYLVAYVTSILGDKLGHLLYKYLNMATVIIGIFVVVLVFLFQ